jgi:hypothetical protein
MLQLRRASDFLAALFRHWWQWMSCGIGTLLSFYAARTNQPNVWIAHSIVALAVLFLMIAAFGAWSDERNKRDMLEKLLDYERPIFKIASGQILTSFNPDRNVITLNMAIEVVNLGARSSCFAWSMKYEFPGFSAEGSARKFYEDQYLWPLRDGGHLVMNRSNSIVSVTSTPLERNDYRNGRALFEIGGDRRKEFDSGIARVTVSCRDILGNLWSQRLDKLYIAPELLTFEHEGVIFDAIETDQADS